MDINNFNTILEGLSDSNIRPRENAMKLLLKEVEVTLPKKKQLSTVVTALLRRLFDDIDKYRAKESTPCLNRVHECMRCLRLVLYKTAFLLKSSDARALLADLTLLFRGNNTAELTAIFDGNIPSILLSIISVPKIVDGLLKDCWTRLVDDISNHLTRSFTSSLDSIAISTLMKCLKVLLKDQIVCFKDVKPSLTNMIFRYLLQTQTSSYSSAAYLFEITNTILISLLSTDVKTGIRICEMIFGISSYHFRSNFKEVKEQLLVFFNIAPEYLRNNLEILGNGVDDGNEITTEAQLISRICDLSANCRLVLFEVLHNYQRSLISTKTGSLTSGNFASLEMVDIELVNGSPGENNKDLWFEFNLIRLSNSTADFKWLNLLSIVKLLDLFYYLHAKIEKRKEPKRIRAETDYLESSLVICQSAEEFIIFLLDSPDHQLLGLQIALFYASNFTMEPHSFPIEPYLSKLYAFKDLKIWVSILIRTLLALGFEFESSVLTQALRINLQMIKDKQSFKVACYTVTQVISMPQFQQLAIDKSLVELIGSIYEMSEVNGPAGLSNESIEFWVVISKFCSSPRTKSTNRLIDWLMCNVTKVNDGNCTDLNSFIQWLFGADFTKQVIRKRINSSFLKYNIELKEAVVLGRFILRTETPITPKIVNSVTFEDATMPFDKKSVSNFVETVQETLTLSENEGLPLLLSILSFSFTVLQCASRISQFNDDLRFSITRLMDGISLRTQEDRDLMISGLMKFQIFNKSGLFITDLIDPMMIVKGTDEYSLENIDGNRSRLQTPDDDFDIGSVRTTNGFHSFKDSNNSFVFSDLLHRDFATSTAVDFLLRYHSDFGFTSGINSMTDEVLAYLETLSAKGFVCGFHRLLQFFHDNDINHIGSEQLLRAVRLLGKFLQDSSIVRILCADFLDQFFQRLFLKGNHGIKQDCCDVLRFLINISTGKSVHGVFDIKQITKLLFRIIEVQELLDLDLPDITGVFFLIIKSSGNLIVNWVMDSITSLIHEIDYSEQLEYFEKFLNCFENFSSSREESACFSLFILQFSKASFGILISGLLKLLKYSDEPHLFTYCETVFCKIIETIKNTNRYDFVLLELFNYWLSENIPLDKFPFSILGFCSFADFITSSQRLLYSIAISRKSNTLDTLASMKPFLSNIKNLDKDTLSLQLPLSITKEGKKQEAIKQLTSISVSNLKQQLPFLLLNLVNLMDLSEDYQSIRKIPSLKASHYFSQLFSDISPLIHHAGEVSISVLDAVHHALSMLKRTNGWPIGSVNFILKNLLLQLTQSNDDVKYQLIVLRRIKLVFLLASSEFKNLDNLRLCLKFLTPSLANITLRRDASTLLDLIFEISDHLIQKLFPTEILPLVEIVVKVIVEGSGFHSDGLISRILQFCELIPEQSPLKNCFLVLYHYLKDNDSDNSPRTPNIEHVCSIIHELTQQSQISSGSVIDLVVLILNLSVTSKETSHAPLLYEFTVEKSTASLFNGILNSRVLLSEPVKGFIGRYLAKYYLDTQDSLHLQSVELGKDLLQLSETRTDKGNIELALIYSKLLKYRKSTTKIEEILGIDYIIGYAGTFASGLLNDLNIKEMVERHTYDVLFMNDQTLSIVGYGIGTSSQSQLQLSQSQSPNGSFRSVNGTTAFSLDDFVSDCMDLPYDQWVHFLSLCLVNSLVKHYPLMKPLMLFLHHRETTSCLNIVPELWIFYIRSQANKMDGVFYKFMNEALLNNDLDSQKVEIVLSLVQIIRVLAMDEPRPFGFLYSQLKLDGFYKMAIRVGLVKFGLLLFEDHCQRSSKETPLLDDSASLLAIYEAIGDNDLIFGVPIKASLEFSLNCLIKNDDSTNNVSSVMFNSARLEASKKLHQTNSIQSMQDLSRSLKNSEFNVLSSMLSDSDVLSAGVITGSDIYDWSWRLNSWDIPEPSKPLCESEIVYKLLRNIYTGKSPLEISAVCTDIYSLLSDHSFRSSSFYETNRREDVLKRLGILLTIERLAGSSDFDLGREIKNQNRTVHHLLANSIPTDTIEDIIHIRRSLYPMLCVPVDGRHPSIMNKSDVLLSVSYESLTLAKLAKLSSDSQSSINNAVFLDEYVKMLKNDNDVSHSVKDLASRISCFNSASMLWDQGQTRPPITMLLQDLNVNIPDITESKFPLSVIDFSKPVLQGYLIKWMSTSREKRPEEVMDFVEVTLSEIEDIKNIQEKCKVFHMIGYFCYEQVKKADLDQQISKLRDRIDHTEAEIRSLRSAAALNNSSREEYGAVKKDLDRSIVTLSIENEQFEILIKNQRSCIEKAIVCFLKCIALDDAYDNEDIDKFFALWFEYSFASGVNRGILNCMDFLPLHKFIPWMAQLTSRLSSSDDEFQTVLEVLILEISKKHTYHSIYHIMNLVSYKFCTNLDAGLKSRMSAAAAITEKLTKELIIGGKGSNMVNYVSALCHNILSFSSEKCGLKKEFDLRDLKLGEFWLSRLPRMNLILPTMKDVPVSLISDYSKVPTIHSVNPIVSVAPTGLSKPKIMKFTLTDGTVHKSVLKGSSDDLRQDAIMLQVLEKVSTIFKIDQHTRKRGMRLRTYKVVPLGPQSGIIQFVSNSIAFGDVVRPLHLTDSMKYAEAVGAMKSYQNDTTAKRIKLYQKIMTKIPPRFRMFFLDKFPDVNEWFHGRQMYTRGLAATSFVGYILGLGDRHMNNILLDVKTCEPIHIDFGVAFDQGRFLPIPELVPFRLTRDMVDGLGVTGVSGSFERCSVHAYRVLRENSETILGILKVLEFDPLHMWVISCLRKQKMLNQLEQLDSDGILSTTPDTNVNEGPKIPPRSSVVNGSDAANAIKACENKLINNRLSVEATVQELIQEATNVERLGVIFAGWSPFY